MSPQRVPLRASCREGPRYRKQRIFRSRHTSRHSEVFLLIGTKFHEGRMVDGYVVDLFILFMQDKIAAKFFTKPIDKKYRTTKTLNTKVFIIEYVL